jgi:creatinine amidohydrolase
MQACEDAAHWPIGALLVRYNEGQSCAATLTLIIIKGKYNMQWENLTAPDFANAVAQTGVCILTLGVLERHSEHLPLGTDTLVAHKIASLAAEQEPAVVFPPFYFGQIYEARCFPGTVTLKPALLLELIQAVIAEIGRNGFKKIILFNGHGGNAHLLPFIAQSTLYEQKPYTLYLFSGELNEDEQHHWEQTCETSLHGHACECETSISLACHSELVHMERVVDNGQPLKRLEGLKGAYSGIWWYANYPEHYAGDAHSATVEKGEILRGLQVNALKRFIKAVKEDIVTPELEKEFFQREAKLHE